MNRRHLFALLGGAAVAPVLPALPMRVVSVSVISAGQPYAGPPLIYRTIPIRIVDQLTESESRIV